MNATYDNLKERVGESTLQLISKLLAMAKDGRTNENEAHTAMRAALSLLAKHNLSASDVEGLGEAEEAVESSDFKPKEKQRYDRWRSALLNAIADTHFCYLYRNRRGGYVLTGTPTNREATILLYSYLEAVIEDNVKEALKSYQGWDAPRTYANAYRLGMVSRIRERLEEQKRQIIEDACGPTKAIVVANPYEVAQKKNLGYLKTQGVRLVSGSSSRSNLGSGAGYYRGREAGANIGLTAGRALTGRR
jgi:hypothetical protein